MQLSKETTKRCHHFFRKLKYNMFNPKVCGKMDIISKYIVVNRLDLKSLHGISTKTEQDEWMKHMGLK